MERIGTADTNCLETLLPLSLKEIVRERTLMRMTFEAVDAVNWPPATSSSNGSTPLPVLRTLTSFCYCSGMFSSRAIAAAVRLEPDIRYLCANDFPTWEELWQFRRKNAPLLRETLARIFQAVCDEAGIPVAFLACVVEADRRLRLAIEADSAAMDGMDE